MFGLLVLCSTIGLYRGLINDAVVAVETLPLSSTAKAVKLVVAAGSMSAAKGENCPCAGKSATWSQLCGSAAAADVERHTMTRSRSRSVGGVTARVTLDPLLVNVSRGAAGGDVSTSRVWVRTTGASVSWPPPEASGSLALTSSAPHRSRALPHCAQGPSSQAMRTLPFCSQGQVPPCKVQLWKQEAQGLVRERSEK